MQSTFASGATDWRKQGLTYYPLRAYCLDRFGARTWKVSVDAAFSCPNADGTVGRGGCIFCNIRSFSPSRRTVRRPIRDQIDEGMRRLRARYKATQCLAYFQPATNTHGAPERIRDLCGEALEHEAVVGIILGTRPDCLPEEVLDVLAEIGKKTWLSVEIGLQSASDRSLAWMNRGHDHATFVDAVTRCKSRGLHVGAHVILGLPGESREEVRHTAYEVARLGLDAVKIHNLYVVKDTVLADRWHDGSVELPDRETYVSYVADFLERISPHCVVDRISGDAPPEYLLAPAWCRDKSAIRRTLEAEFRRRGTRQSSLWSPHGSQGSGRIGR